MALQLTADVNWLGVVVATVIYQVLGALWYGPLFGSRWMDSMGYAPDDLAGEDATTGYVITAIGALVATLALALLIDWTGATSPTGGLTVGLLVGIGFVATTALQAVPFEDRSWTVYLLNAGYNVVALAIAGLVIVLL